MNLKKAWMRVLTIKLFSKKLKKELTFGNNWEKGKTDLSITVDGTKYLSAMKDRCTIKITNLTYKEMIEIINGEFYDVEVFCGYRNGNVFKIFKGGVLFISNKLGDRKSNDIIIMCSNTLVAKYGQSRINLSLNSGINMYDAISYVTKMAGIKNGYIDESLKNKILTEAMIDNESITSWIDTLCSNNGYLVNTDATMENDFSIFNPYSSNFRKIKLTTEEIILTQGYPTLDSQGLNLALMPTENFCPGDTIILDNAIIDIGTENESDAYKNLGQFLDPNNSYVLTEINYSLENRGNSFELRCKGRAKVMWNRLWLTGE